MHFRVFLRNALSPVLGVNCADPVLTWALRRQMWALDRGAWKHGAAAFFAGALPLAALLGAASALGWRPFDWALLLIVVLRPIADMLALAGSWGQISSEFRSGRWDMIRLTTQTEGGMLRAHEAAVHARLWRPLWAALGAQTASLLIAALWLSSQPLAGEMALNMSIATLLASLLASELLMRVRAAATVGLALSAASPRAGTAVVFGGLVLLLLWLVQGAVLIFGLMFASLGTGLISLIIGELSSVAFILLFPALWLLAVHHFVRRVALHSLANAVIRRDEAF